MSPDGKVVFVTSEDEGTVAVVDLASRAVTKTIKVGRRPRGIVFTPDGSRAFISNENDAKLSIIDVAKLEARARSLPAKAASRWASRSPKTARRFT